MAGSYGIVMSRADLSVRLVAMIICEHTSSQLSDIKQSLVSFESQFCHSFAKVKSKLQDSIQVVVDCRLMQCYAVPLLEKNDHVFDATLSRFLLKVESILPFPNLNLCLLRQSAKTSATNIWHSIRSSVACCPEVISVLINSKAPTVEGALSCNHPRTVTRHIRACDYYADA